MKKIVLIDGHSILNRAFYGVPPLTDAEGHPTNAVYGFLNIMFRILDSEKPDMIAVAFDLSAPTFRHQKYPEYKGTRHPMPEELHEQVPVMKDVLSLMHIPVLSREGYEADDIIGTIAGQYAEKGYEVTIVSGDRDLLQLVRDHIKISLPKTSRGVTTVTEYYPEDVKRDFSVTPEEIVELKALMGDTSDNIPGLPGVGEKTAAAIISRYHTIYEAREHAAEIKPPRASKALQENFEKAELSRWLAKIDTQAPVDLQESVFPDILNRNVYEKFAKLGFRSLLKKFDFTEASGSAAADTGDGNTVIKDGSVTYVKNLKQYIKEHRLSYDPDIYDIGIAEYLVNPLNKGFDDFDRETARNILQQVKDCGMWELYTEIEIPLVYSLARMEEKGIRVDGERLTEYGSSLKEQLNVLEGEIYLDAGEIFNINSPKQLGEILFGKMGLKGGKKTKTGYSTSADVLAKLTEEHPIIRKILDYRQLSKLYTTYAVGLLGYIFSDGRIHGNFNQTVTATGRISSTDPNLQNIPVRTELGSRIRDVFVAEDGYVFVDADYSQIELRVLAAVSGDSALIQAYKDAVDIHTVTASRVFHVPEAEVTPQMRRNAKAVNFGVVYGISAFGLSEGLSISRAEAQEYINNYFKTYPKVKEYLDSRITFAKENGYVRTLYGRRRPVPELKSSNFMQRQFGERVAMNSPIQGTAADIIKIAMIRTEKALQEAGLDAAIVLQVHDELLIEVKEEQAEEAKRIIEETMKNAADIGVTLEVDAHIGRTWMEAK